MPEYKDLWSAYKLRWNRRRALFRSFRKRRQLTAVVDRTGQIAPGEILAFVCVRNEIGRLRHFLRHYRDLGVGHFLFVDNDSDDGTAEFLSSQHDVSLWRTGASYKRARFGMDWLGWLQMKHGHGHWCVTVDADELLIYPHHDTRPLTDLTAWLDAQGQDSFGAMMLDLYPEGRLGDTQHDPSGDPTEALCWFDGWNYWAQRQPKLQNLWLQGGVRARCFFAAEPEHAPTLNKIPLVRWHRRHTYVSSMHTMLPRRLNHTYDEAGIQRTTGVLLHTKFLDSIVDRSAEEKERKEHFENSALYDDYYDSLSANPVLWCPDSLRFDGWRNLEEIGLMSRGNWS